MSTTMYMRTSMVLQIILLTLLVQNRCVIAREYHVKKKFSNDSYDLLTTEHNAFTFLNTESGFSEDASTTTLSQDITEGTTSYSQWMDSLISQDECYVYGTCAWKDTLLKRDIEYCHCSPDCILFNDCCNNFGIQDQKRELPFRGCALVQQRKNALIQAVGIIVINKCPENYLNNETVNNCLQNFTQVGPFVVGKNGTIYKNKYCAVCQGIFEFVFYNIKISSIYSDHLHPRYDHLNQMERLELYLSHPDVEYTLVPPNGTDERRCIVYETNFYDDETQECKDYGINPVLTMHRNMELHLYRNVFCRRHEGYTFSTCYGRSARDSLDLFALTAMFTFSSISNRECKDDEEKVNGICVALPQHTNLLEYVFLSLHVKENITVTFLKQLVFGMMATVTTEDAMIDEAACFDESSTGNGTLIYVKLSLRVFKQMNTKEVAGLVKQLQSFEWEAQISLETNNLINVFIKHVDPQIFVDYSEKNIQPSFRYILRPGLQMMTIPRARERLVSDMNLSNVYQTAKSIFCFDLFVEMLYVNPHLLIDKITCLNHVFREKGVSIEFLKSILTYVGGSVSIFALVLSIVVSRKLRLSDSIPGNNLENLSVALALSNLFFMFGIGANHFQIVCYVFGVILHYLWLVAFSFMTLTVTFLCYSLLKMVSFINYDKDVSRKTKRIMTGTGLCFPLLFVLPAVILDLLDFPMFDASYAGTICFPTGALTNLAFFSGPIIVSMFVNLVTITILMVYMIRHSIKMNQVRKSQTFQQGEVYIRVCLLAGLTWILAIIGSVLNFDYLDFITIVLCSLQGLCVALANLSTKHVCRSLGELRFRTSTNSTKSSTVVESKKK